MVRGIAVLLVAVLTSSAFGEITCAGWQASAADRMACCQRAAHDCPDQAAADACCAQQEQTHQPGMTIAAVTIAAPSVLDGVFAPSPDLAAPLTAATRHDPLAPPLRHAPPGSFELPLRI